MAWTTPTVRTTGELITASIWNTDLVADLVELRAGGLSIASQAALDFIYGASATQLARLAAGSALQYPRINAAGNGWEFATLSSPLSLLRSQSGSTSSLAVQNLDTIAISGLGVLDGLFVSMSFSHSTGAAMILWLYNSTDSVDVWGTAAVGAGLGTQVNAWGNAFAMIRLGDVGGLKKVGGQGSTNSTSGFYTTASTFTTNYTGSWTLALRTNGMAAGTLTWSWSVYKVGG